jgi:hypothetical protein
MLVPIMGLCPSGDAKPDRRVLTQEEKDRLVLLFETAGAPGIVVEAENSGDIFNPEHMEKALRLEDEHANIRHVLWEFL